jgi:hypothetical protein
MFPIDDTLNGSEIVTIDNEAMADDSLTDVRPAMGDSLKRITLRQTLLDGLNTFLPQQDINHFLHSKKKGHASLRKLAWP